MNKLQKFVKNPYVIFCLPAIEDKMKWVSDETYIKLVYRARCGEKLNLNPPRKYNEKLQWLKLHDRNPLYTMLVDKYRVKPWVAERVGDEHVTKTYCAWEHVEEIDLSRLPERFVLKTNHDCGGVAICRGKATFDFEAVKRKLNKHLKTSYYWRTREWPYKDVRPLVFAEEYLEDAGGDTGLIDYKVTCFGGKPGIIEVHVGRFGNHTCNLYDPDWKPLYIDWDPNPRAIPELPRPEHLDQMLEFSAKLTSGFPHMRADWYLINGRLVFGELTLFAGAGFDPIDEKNDILMGSQIDLSLAYGPLD